MLNPYDIMRLYNNVLINEVHAYRVDEKDIKRGIREMSDVYKPNKANWTQEVSRAADYNDIGHRCAYLHKYAPLHTAMVQDLLRRILYENDDICYAMMSSGEKCLKICSLGGGPGTDAIGVLSAVHQVFGLQKCSVQVVELKSQWKYTFQAILDELVYEDYGPFSRNLCRDYFNYSYITADLLGKMSNDVNRSLASANLITMVKFVSAATCMDTTNRIRKIFNSMKPGALVLFIDNAAGGFSEMISELGQQCNLLPIFGPLNHLLYVNPIFTIERYGYISCSETKVTVHVLMKPLQNLNILRTRLYYNQNLDIPNSQLVSDDSPIHDTKSSSIKFSALQFHNQQTLPSPPTGFKLENNQLGNNANMKFSVGNHRGNTEPIPTNDHKSPLNCSEESPSESVGHRISISGVSSGKNGPVINTNTINNYGTQVSNTRLPSNNEILNSKEFDIIKNGFEEVLIEVSKNLRTIPDMNSSFKQYISKDIKSDPTSELTNSKELTVPASREGDTEVTQNKSIRKVISCDPKTEQNPSLNSSYLSHNQSSDLLTRDNTKSLESNTSKADKEGCFDQMISIIGRISCFCFKR